MGDVSINVYGILDIEDHKIKKMMKIIEDCNDVGVDIPKEIEIVFNKMGIDVDDISEGEISVDIKKKEYNAEMIEGYDVDVKDIPKEVKTIRFIVNYD